MANVNKNLLIGGGAVLLVLAAVSVAVMIGGGDDPAPPVGPNVAPAPAQTVSQPQAERAPVRGASRAAGPARLDAPEEQEVEEAAADQGVMKPAKKTRKDRRPRRRRPQKEETEEAEAPIPEEPTGGKAKPAKLF